MSKSTRVTQNSSSAIASIYAARQNLLAQLEKRGYNTDEYAFCSVNEVNSMHQTDQLDMMMSLEEPNEDGVKTKIYVKFFSGKKFAVNNMQEIIEDLFVYDEVLTKADNLLIVTKDDPIDTVISYQKHIWEQDKIFATIVCMNRLQFNILEHELVPSHKILTLAETEEVKKRYNIMNDSQFPEISRFDPVAVAIGIRPGQVCKIMRPSKTAVWSPYFRICI